MGAATEVVKKAYDAFGRGDVAGILALCAAQVDWEFVGPPKLGYAGKRRNHAEISDFFSKVHELDDMQARMSFTVEVGSLGQLKKALHVVGEVKGVMSAGRRGFAS